jgi:tRNA-guanine family transglycosylase
VTLYRQRTLETDHGSVETPVLFPVRNIGKRSSDNTPAYAGSIPDLSTAMVNARAIRQRATQWGRLQEGARFRDEMGVPEETVVFADSGGFDFSDEAVDTTPERTLETQREIGADLFGTVDLPLSRDKRAAENQQRIEQSIDHAIRASDHHNGEELLLASVHGYDPETIRNGIRYLERHGEFDGYALGSLVSIRTDYTKTTKLIVAARQATEKHLHVYGLGGIVYLPLLLYLGVDSFDSSSFLQSAGKRNYLLPGFGGTELRHVETLERLPCPCSVCATKSLETVRSDRDLLTKHNLWAITTELRRFRYIYETNDDIEDYLDFRFRGNEVMERAYGTAKQQVRRLS